MEYGNEIEDAMAIYKAKVIGPMTTSTGAKYYTLQLEYYADEEDQEGVSCSVNLCYNGHVWDISVDEQTWEMQFQITDPNIKNVLPVLMKTVKQNMGSIILDYKKRQKVVTEMLNNLDEIVFVEIKE